MDRAEFNEVVEKSGLRPDVVGHLLDQGWVFVVGEGTTDKIALWVAPTVGVPDYIFHDEPICDRKCGNMAPHYHGLPCNVGCESCHAVCHPQCPAYEMKES